MTKLIQNSEMKKKITKNRNEIRSLKMEMSTNYQKLENNEDQNKYKSSQKLQMFQIQLKHM